MLFVPLEGFSYHKSFINSKKFANSTKEGGSSCLITAVEPQLSGLVGTLVNGLDSRNMNINEIEM